MAQVAGTFRTNDMIGIREDLTDAIYNISPKETPFMSSIARVSGEATRHEWQTDSLAAASGSNAQIEGDDATFATLSPTTRVSNIMQISRKAIVVSGTSRAVNTAGRSDEFEYQAAKAAAEIKRDMETILLSNQDSTVGTVTTARKLGGLEAWFTSNVSRGGGGASGGFSNGIVAAATDASAGGVRSFTEALLKTVISSCWSAGGMPDTVMVGPFNKQAASTFAGIATQYRENKGVKQATILAAADVYVSDFGELKIVPNRFQRDRSALVLEMDKWAVGYLRPFKTEKLAKTGDADKAMMTVEYTLVSRNQAASGVVADLRTS